MIMMFLCVPLIFFADAFCAELSPIYYSKSNMSNDSKSIDFQNERAEELNKKMFIDQFFSYLSYLGNPENKIDVDSLQGYLNNECIIESNNEILCRGIFEFIAYIDRMQQKYESVIYSNFLEDPVIKGEKAKIHFQVHCIDKTGQQRDLDAKAILTIQNGKISYWKEVFQDIQ